jgi:UDP-N-acetylmuramate dehydrogenase
VKAVPFATLTTFEIGGGPRAMVEVKKPEQLPKLLSQTRKRRQPIFVLGGGSNLLVSDGGFPGTVLRMRNCGFDALEQGPEQVIVRAGAGLDWDLMVSMTVERGWGGLECLSGIPGMVGAAPIQNIGAYGQEAAESIHRVEVTERSSGAAYVLDAIDCGFGYRHSHFKSIWRDRFVVTAVQFALTPGAMARPRYRDLQNRFPGVEQVSLAEMREGVLEIRRSKSMVWDLADPNHRSAGSFFTNPLVGDRLAHALLDTHPTMPNFTAGPSEVKLSAAWLIERAGFTKGLERGRVGLSTNHVLALINRGGASARELLYLATEVRQGVWDKFGVELMPEPELLGFAQTLDELMPITR